MRSDIQGQVDWILASRWSWTLYGNAVYSQNDGTNRGGYPWKPAHRLKMRGNRRKCPSWNNRERCKTAGRRLL